jgi:hypothetical protein
LRSFTGAIRGARTFPAISQPEKQREQDDASEDNPFRNFNFGLGYIVRERGGSG